ncbi:hypothetical protein M8494_06270 [Serratia ureilytica]
MSGNPSPMRNLLVNVSKTSPCATRKRRRPPLAAGQNRRQTESKRQPHAGSAVHQPAGQRRRRRIRPAGTAGDGALRAVLELAKPGEGTRRSSTACSSRSMSCTAI